MYSRFTFTFSPQNPHAVDSLYSDLSSHATLPPLFRRLLQFSLAADAPRGRHSDCCCYEHSRNAIPLAIPIPDTSATTHNSTDFPPPTDTATHAYHDSTHASHYAAISTTNMAADGPVSSTTATTTACTTSPPYSAFSVHSTSTGVHAAFFSSNSPHHNLLQPHNRLRNQSRSQHKHNGTPLKGFGNLSRLFHQLHSQAKYIQP